MREGESKRDTGREGESKRERGIERDSMGETERKRTRVR